MSEKKLLRTWLTSALTKETLVETKLKGDKATWPIIDITVSNFDCDAAH